MKIAVVTDSATCLTAEQAAAHNITVVPITVIFGQHVYRENIDLTTEEFYHKLETEPELPTTAQISMGQIQAVYDDLAAQGYDAVISIHLSSGITTFYQNLVAYLPNVTNIKVYPFDSLLASAAEADQALYAAKLVAAGTAPEAIITALEKLRASQRVDFMVANLSHLVRTGRLSNASAMVGNMLRIKPILSFDEAGAINIVAKERTMRRAYQHAKKELATYIEESPYPVRATVVDGDNAEESAKWLADLQATYPQITLATSHLGPVLGTHVGRKVMGLIWSYDFEKM
jgi:DegV family protein with EDD domain